MCAVCVTVLLVPAGASAALADDPPPPTTTTTPTTPAPQPAPDPAPPVKPKPKPQPPSQPRPAPTPLPQQTQPAPAPAQQPHVVQTQKPAVTKKPVRAHVKRKHHRKAAAKPKPAVPKIKVSKTLGASVGLRSPVKADGSTDVGALLIVMGLALAIACFTLAVIPARSVPWRPGAIFVSERQADLTIVGLALLMAAAFTVFWTKGP